MPAKVKLPRAQLYHLRYDFGMTYESIAEMFDVSYFTIRRKLKPNVDKHGRCADCGKPIDSRATRCQKCSAPIKGGIFGRGSDNPNWGGGENHVCWLGDDVEIECENCGAVFKIRPYEERRFCSMKCTREFRKPRLVARICENCGAEFEFNPAKMGKRSVDSRRFCCHPCLIEWQCGGNHGMWNGGTGHLPYGPGWTEDLKNQIRHRDDFTCAICGQFGNQVHHINYDKFNNDSANLITLCDGCHSCTNVDRHYWYPAIYFLLHRHFPEQTFDDLKANRAAI